MSLPAPYSEVYLAGDGVSTVFAFGDNFDPISDTLVECKIYFPGGYETVPTFTVDMTTRSITISALTQPDGTVLTAPPVGSVVRIYRDEPEAQNVTAGQLQSFTAKQLESALDAIVAMIQEVSYTVDHKTVRLTEPQRDIALQELSQLADQHLIYWDFDSRKLVVTNFPQQDVVRCTNGLFFRVKIDPDTQHKYLQWSLDESDWHSVNVEAAQMLAQNAYDLADDAYDLASTTRGELNAHKANHSNPHETTLANLIDTNFNNLTSGQFLQFNGINWVNVDYSTTVAWGGIGGDILDQADLQAEFSTKVNDVKVNNVSVVTNNVANINIDLTPYARLDTVQTFTAKQIFNSEIEATNTITLTATGSLRTLSDNTYYDLIRYNVSRIEVGSANTQTNLLGSGAHALYNGNDIAMKSEVDLAANSGRMITDQGLWYAKMYAATVALSAEDGTNYADFSQVDGQGNPIIVIYERQNGAWVQSETITPPADYDGYVSITSKIWDIAEQAGQQGGRILWNHTSKDFTPYPMIVSFNGQNITNSTFSGGTITNSTFSGTATLSGISTVIMPQNSSAKQIVNKEYVDDAVAAMQVYLPDLFDFKWKDCTMTRTGWKLSDGNWINKADAPTAYNELYNDVVACVVWAVINTPGVYTKQRNPSIGDPVYSDYYLTEQIGTVSAYANDSITYNDITVPFLDMYSFNGSATETIAGVSVLVRRGNGGKKYSLIRSSTKDPTGDSDVTALYNATGIAWLYVLDAENERFKLPRTTFGFVGLRDNIGDYVAPELPNITFSAAGVVRSGTGALTTGSNTGSYVGPRSSNNLYEKSLSFSATNSSSVYKNDATVQPPATQMYLYFYVGA